VIRQTRTVDNPLKLPNLLVIMSHCKWCFYEVTQREQSWKTEISSADFITEMTNNVRDERMIFVELPPGAQGHLCGSPLEAIAYAIRKDPAKKPQLKEIAQRLLASDGTQPDSSPGSTSLTSASFVQRIQSYFPHFHDKWPECLVFKGGGTKGVVYAGAIQQLKEEAGKREGGSDAFKNIKKFAGTSAGSQVAALLAVGLTGEELEQVNYKSNWKKLLDDNSGCCGFPVPCCGPLWGFADIRNYYRLARHHGFCRGDYLQETIEKVIREKTQMPDYKFKDLPEDVELKIGVCDIVSKKFMFLDKNNAPDMPIALACRASSAIPCVFKPVHYTVEGVPRVFVDGGLEGNLPLSAFEKTRTLAFNLRAPSQANHADAPASLTHFLGDVADMLLNSAQSEHGCDMLESVHEGLRNRQVHIVHIDTKGYGALDIKMGDEEIKVLMESGRHAVKTYFSDPSQSI